jgi:PKD repeat protein
LDHRGAWAFLGVRAMIGRVRVVLRRARRAIVLGGLCVLLLPSARGLASTDTTISFDDLPANTVITNQYDSQGVSFGTAASFGQPSPGNFDCGSPTAIGFPSPASGSQVARLPNCQGIEFHKSGTFGKFRAPRRKISVKVRSGGTPSPVQLIGYAEGGIAVATSSVGVDGSGWTTITVEQAAGEAPAMQYFALYRQEFWDATLYVDDLTFDNLGAPLDSSGVSFSATAGSEFSGVVAHFADGDPTATSADYAVSIEWGDGATSSGSVSGANGSFEVRGTHMYATAGTYAVKVTVTKSGGKETSTTSTANVAPAVMPDFTISVSPPSATIQQGDDWPVYQVTVEAVNGFSNAVALSLSGVPVRGRFQPSIVMGSGTSRLRVPSNLAPGTYQLTITGTSGSLARSAGAKLVVRAVTTPPASPTPPTPTPIYNMRANGIEVTQGIQNIYTAFRGGQLPSNCLASGSCQRPVWAPVGYQGVLLASHSKTVARVFGDWSRPDFNGFAGPLGGVYVELHGYRDGRELRLSPLLDEEGPVTLPYSPSLPGLVSEQERLQSLGAFTFTLPDSWTEGTITLKAIMRRLSVFQRSLPGGASAGLPVECTIPDDCRLDNSFTLTDIDFTPTAHVVIAPIRLVVRGARPLPAPSRVFDAARWVHPGGERFEVLPYVATILATRYWKYTDKSPECQDKKGSDGKVDVGKCQADAVSDAVARWAARNPGFYDLPIGVSDRGGGAALWSIYNLPAGNADPATPDGSHQPYAWANKDRPLTSVAHELGHNFGDAHAGLQCGGQEYWPPDNRGDIQGVGLDRRRPPFFVSGRPQRYNVVAPNAPGHGGEVLDVMSYCPANENDHWISTRNWNKELGALHRFGDRVGFGPRLPQTGSIPLPKQPPVVLQADAVVDEFGTRIIDVLAPARPETPANPSAYRLVVRDRSGRAIAETAMGAGSLTAHHRAVTELTATVPAQGVATVEVWHGTKMLATRRASRTTPQVGILSPRGGTVGAGRVLVRWKASDRDHDALTTEIYSSIDAGRTWRLIYSGPNSGSANLPASYFPGSQRSRVLVRVSDGFNERGAISPIFRSIGTPPQVRILAPEPSQPVLGSSTVLLEGEAFDDRLRPLRAGRLVWYAGTRKVGTGASLAVRSLPAGRVRLTLVATDAVGRKGSASLVVRVRGVKPAFLQLETPGRLAREAKRMKIAIESTIPAQLTVSGRGVRTLGGRVVGLRVHAFRLRVQPGRRPLVLRVVLAAGGKVAVERIRITR